MFKKNQKHLQKPLFSTVTSLPDKQKKRLEGSWARAFYEDVFCRIDETIFEILYSDRASRPNVPVNVLMGAEILKAGNGWTDQEMYDQISYNLQVRYALGLNDFAEMPFDLRTVYNFRQKLVEHMREIGEDLVNECFERITDEQLVAYEVSSTTQRVDSKQISSNIREGSRLRLLLETTRKTWQMLRIEDQERLREEFAPYVKHKVSHYLYGLKGEKHRPQIEQIGELMGGWVTELEEGYGNEETYEILRRVFSDHFKVEEAEVVAKENEELSANSVQSVDDLDASYRRKNGDSYVGYTVNVTETVSEKKDGLGLITNVQVAPNTTEDADLLAEALPNLADRTDLEVLYSDGGYCSPDVDELCHAYGVRQVPTAIRGADPNLEELSVNSLQFTFDSDGVPTHVCCPHGHPLELKLGRKPNRFIARLSATCCALCHHELREKRGGDSEQSFPFYFDKAKAHLARRRQHLADFLAGESNPRAAIEATVRELTCRLHRPKLSVRGQARVSMVLSGSAMMCNLRRIWKYQQTDRYLSSSLCHFLSDASTNGLFTAICAFGVELDAVLRWRRSPRFLALGGFGV